MFGERTNNKVVQGLYIFVVGAFMIHVWYLIASIMIQMVYFSFQYFL